MDRRWTRSYPERMAVNINLTFMSRSVVESVRALETVAREFDHARLKVGISIHPVRRIIGVGGKNIETFFEKERQHGLMNRDYRWITAVYFLYQTDTYADCQSAERALVTRLRELAPQRAVNEVGGGGGRVPASGPYYVYLARS